LGKSCPTTPTQSTRPIDLGDPAVITASNTCNNALVCKKILYEVAEIIILKTMAEMPGKFNMRREGPFTVTEKNRQLQNSIR
jgi:hypothetical protein